MVKKKIYTINMVISIMLLLVLASISTVKAAPEITLTPTTGEPDDSVEIVGTGFAPSTTVGIGVGYEVEVVGLAVTVIGEGGEPAAAYEPWYGYLDNWGYKGPIKPGSFNVTSSIDTVIIPMYDEFGNGTLSSDSQYFYTAGINYSSGVFNRVSTADLSGYDLTDAHVCNYTRYQTSATTDECIATDSSGSFTATIDFPLYNNGTAIVTAVDELGNVATSEFLVFGSTIPEGLSFGVVMILSSVVLVFSSIVFRKRLKIGK